MILHILRALFILMMAAVGWFYLGQMEFHFTEPASEWDWLSMPILLSIGVLFVCVDILAPRKKLVVFSGTFLGLMVGLLFAYALSFVAGMMLDRFLPAMDTLARDYPFRKAHHDMIVQFANVSIGIICCYLSISFILQTKDDFRFIIPYVEFSKQAKGARPVLIDTSVLIDGRIAEVIQSGFIDSRMLVPRFVLDELQTLADSADKLKRNRGRRGLDILARLRSNRKVELAIYDSSIRETKEDQGVDQKLLSLTRELNGRLMTTDFNLCKVAEVRQVEVINLNDLAAALRPAVLPGEKMQVKLIKAGEDPTQGVGYLDDGTMVVVENGRQYLNQDVELTVNNVLQTSAGRMIFGRMGDAPPARGRGADTHRA